MVVWECLKVASDIFSNSIKDVSRVCKDVWRMFLECFGYVPLMFLGCSKDILDMFNFGSKHV